MALTRNPVKHATTPSLVPMNFQGCDEKNIRRKDLTPRWCPQMV